MKLRIYPALVAIAVYHLALPLSLYAQGSLTPPGPPAPTMKTLDQVEARTPIDVTHTPGDATNQFIISNSGSYYLTGNVTGVPGKNGIEITASDVTIDLNGFALGGVAGAITGIVALPTASNSRVFNGTITNWPTHGVVLAENSQVYHVAATNNGARGFYLAEHAAVSWCTASGNGERGLQAGRNSLVSHCIAVNNGIGIIVFDLSRVESCVADDNTGDGIEFTNGCAVVDCVADENGSVQLPASGILATNGASGCSVLDCTARRNFANGIVAEEGTVIMRCALVANRMHGIRAFGNANSVSECTAFNNGRRQRHHHRWR